jgi:predicted transcriptional regulator of viral defense system
MNTKPDYDQLYEVAENQAGYFTAHQARGVGFSWERLSSNVKNGRFLRVAQGIYRLSHFPSSPHEDLFVAWLRTGKDSVISHESALAVYDLADVLPGKVHVIVPRTASRRRRGIRLHTSRLNPGEVTFREGLPLTTVPRTIADVILSGLADEEIHKAIHEALQRGLATREDLLGVARLRGGKVDRVIRHALESEASP